MGILLYFLTFFDLYDLKFEKIKNFKYFPFNLYFEYISKYI